MDIAQLRRLSGTPAVLLCCLLVFHLVANALWLSGDFSLSSYPHYHGDKVLAVLSLLQRDVHVFVPISSYATAWLMHAAGFAWEAYYAIGSLYLVVLLLATYWLTTMIAHPRVAVFACAVLSFYPVVYGTSRWFDFHIPITAHVVLHYALALRYAGRPHWIFILALLANAFFGTFIGGYNMTEARTFLLWSTGAWLYGLIYGLKGWSRDRVLYGFCYLCAWLTLYLRIAVYSGVLDMEDSFFTSHTAVDLQGPVERILSVLAYGCVFPGWMLGIFFSTLTVVSCFGLCRKNIPRDVAFLLGLWAIPPMFVLSYLEKKSLHYVIPLVPVLAMVTALGMLGSKRRWKSSLARFSVVLGIAQCLWLSFGRYDAAAFPLFSTSIWPGHGQFFTGNALFVGLPDRKVLREPIKQAACKMADVILPPEKLPGTERLHIAFLSFWEEAATVAATEGIGLLLNRGALPIITQVSRSKIYNLPVFQSPDWVRGDYLKGALGADYIVMSKNSFAFYERELATGQLGAAYDIIASIPISAPVIPREELPRLLVAKAYMEDADCLTLLARRR